MSYTVYSDAGYLTPGSIGKKLMRKIATRSPIMKGFIR